MIIHATTDLSAGNTNNAITLAEQFGVYLIIKVEHKPGFFGYSEAEVVETFTNYRRAVKSYIEHGGQMRREF